LFVVGGGGGSPAAPHNCFLHPGLIRPAYNNGGSLPWHATLVASAAASNHAIYQGMAPGATIMSAGVFGSFYQQNVDALVWALDNGAHIVNASYGACGGPYQDALDYAYDTYARARRKLLVISSGNFASCTNYNVWSPGGGWNVLTVGGSDDRENADWSDDVMWSDSTYINPTTSMGDHEKPEVVAPGRDIRGIERNGIERQANGTSFASPQVSGEAALLIHRNSALGSLPEALRAIIMATATNNVDGPTGVPSGTDHKDGVGGINANLADTVASLRKTDSTPCSGPCWWADTITPSSFDSAGYRSYYFTGKAGDRIRVAIAWDSFANCPSIGEGCGIDVLSTDLQLAVWAPNGALLTGGSSAGWDKSYELVPAAEYMVLPQDGTYRIGVYKQSFTEAQNFLGVAWTTVPPSTPAVDSRGANQLDVYIRGGDDAVWMKSFNGSSWTGWQLIGGTATSDPAAISWGGGRIDVFVRGTSNSIYQRTFNGTNWSATWTSLGGAATSAPAVASWGPNRLDVFIRGAGNAIFWKTSTNGTTWPATWTNLGGSATSAPAAVSWGTNRIDLFMRSTDNSIHWNRYNGSSWTGWTSLGGVGTSAPTVASWGPNRLDLFVRNTLSGVSQNTFNGGPSFLGWSGLGGTIVGNPTAVSWGSNRIDLFVQSDVSNLLFQNSFASGWSVWTPRGEVP
jgi:hypothetical protein